MRPRLFDEVQALYSTDMIDVFSGGLIYEYSQEPNNYGLVEIDSNGNVKLLPDFLALRNQFETLPQIDYVHVAKAMKKNANDIQVKMTTQKYGLPKCEENYPNLDISNGIPKSQGSELIESGVAVTKGKNIPTKDEIEVKQKITGVTGDPYPTKVLRFSGTLSSDKHESAIDQINCTYNDLEDIIGDPSDEATSLSTDGESRSPIMVVIQRFAKLLQQLYRTVASRFSE